MKKQICKNCAFYQAYYREMSSIYRRTTNGYCTRKRKILTESLFCPDFSCNQNREASKDERRIKTLEQALKSINDIAQILKTKEQEKIEE